MTIVQQEDPVLRIKAQEIPVEEITSKRVQDIIARMKHDLATQDDGVAIAAPQIGESVRIFAVSHRVFQKYGADEKPLDPVLTEKDDKVYINPVITKLSKKKEFLEEGCLSCRWWYGYVKRSLQATIDAYDEHGKPFTQGAGGLLAQIFQHETDHLNGILFIDKAQDLQEVNPEDLKDIRDPKNLKNQL